MNILIDCGTHLGEGMTTLIKKYSIDDNQWKIFTFEPNKDSYEQVIKKEFKLKNINFINKAIWVTDDTIIFHAETPFNSEKNNGASSTLINLDDWKPKSVNNPGVGEFNNSYIVQCLNLSKFIEKNFLPTDFIIVKLDIEGAEFEVLNGLIKSGAIKYINDLYVEFHEWAMNSKTVWSKFKLKMEIKIKNRKLKFTEWH